MPAGIGTIEIKAMKDHGYPIEVAVGVTGRFGDARPDHSAEPALRDLRHDGECLDRLAVPRRRRPRRADDDAHDDHGRGLGAACRGWGSDARLQSRADRQGA